MKPKDELIRVVRSPSDVVSLDFSGKMPGRGAYICRDNDCFNRVIKSNALSRTFKMQIPEDIKNEISDKINQSIIDQK